MKNLILLFILTLIFQACRKDKNEGNDAPVVVVDTVSTEKPKDKGIDYSLPDELLKEKIISYEKNFRFKYSSLKKVDHVDVDILYPTDSAFKVINITGKYSNGNSSGKYFENVFVSKKHILKTGINDKVFRIDQKRSGYTLFTKNILDNKSEISILDTHLKKDSLISQPDSSDKNFYYDLLSSKQIEFDLPLDRKALLIRKKNRFTPDSIMADSSGLNFTYYQADKPFFKIPVNLPIATYYAVSGDSLGYKILTARINDSLSSQMVIAARGNAMKSYGTFLNDSVFRLTGITEKLRRNDTHMVSYSVDSIVSSYSYNKSFDFREIKKDTFHLKKDYPQYYANLKDSVFMVLGKPFSINNTFAKWRYGVSYLNGTDSDSRHIMVKVLEKYLISDQKGDTLFRYPIGRSSNISADIANLDNTEAGTELADINHDGYTDLYFSKGKDTEGNEEFTVYAFDPRVKKYNYSKSLSGTSITGSLKTDDLRRTTQYSRKIGDDQYSVTRTYFDNKGTTVLREIFWNTVNRKQDSLEINLNYQKVQGKGIVDKRTETASHEEWNGKNLKTKFLEWVNNQ